MAMRKPGGSLIAFSCNGALLHACVGSKFTLLASECNPGDVTPGKKKEEAVCISKRPLLFVVYQGAGLKRRWNYS
jgi:hypothetical protein